MDIARTDGPSGARQQIMKTGHSVGVGFGPRACGLAGRCVFLILLAFGLGSQLASVEAGPLKSAKTPGTPEPAAKPATTPQANVTPQAEVQTAPTKVEEPPEKRVIEEGVTQPGTRLYSTGAGSVIVQVARPLTVQQLQVVKGKPVVQRRMVKKNDSAFTDGIYLLSPGPERLIASNRQIGQVVNLGLLPKGEIIFGIKTPEDYTFQTGEAARNPDDKVHALVKVFRSGKIEVWFEDLPAGQSDFDYNDVVIDLSGGVTCIPLNDATAKAP
jgi:hypothetical protein